MGAADAAVVDEADWVRYDTLQRHNAKSIKAPRDWTTRCTAAERTGAARGRKGKSLPFQPRRSGLVGWNTGQVSPRQPLRRLSSWALGVTLAAGALAAAAPVSPHSARTTDRPVRAGRLR